MISFLAVLLSISCPVPIVFCYCRGSSILFVALSYSHGLIFALMYWSSCPVLAVLLWAVLCCCPVSAIMSWLCCPNFPFLLVMSWLSCPGCLVLVTRSRCPVPVVLCWLSCLPVISCCHFWLSYPILAVLFWSSFAVLAVIPQLPHTGCPGLSFEEKSSETGKIVNNSQE